METSKSLFSLKNDLGEEKTYEMLFTFDSDVTKKSYMVYTDHYMDKDGKERVYASIYDPSGNDQNIYPIESEAEWDIIENILIRTIFMFLCFNLRLNFLITSFSSTFDTHSSFFNIFNTSLHELQSFKCFSIN